MPVGREPPAGSSPLGTVHSAGRTEAFAAGRWADYGRVNIGWQWDCLWNYRHALVVRASGADPYVVLLDNVNYRNGHGFYD